jgi:hypothetical protein
MKTVFALITALSSPLAFACTGISSLPFAITSPGQYCLTANLISAGGGIQISIAANDVTLDLAGFTLSCNASQNGIFATAAQSGIKVKNGGVRGCNFAVALNQCTACEVREITAINNAVGISVGATGGSGVKVSDNVIRNDQSNSGNPAIELASYASEARGNQISGSNVGIANRGKGNIIRDNSFGLCGTAIRFDVRATYQDNLTQQCTTAFTGADLAGSSDAGGNR